MAAKTSPVVGIVMGSDSDWPTMQAAAALLKEFSIPFEARVVSAHRTPDLLFEYATQARSKGLRVIIAGAGGAAHLPGMLAAKTSGPGCIQTSSGHGFAPIHCANAQGNSCCHVCHR